MYGKNICWHLVMLSEIVNSGFSIPAPLHGRASVPQFKEDIGSQRLNLKVLRGELSKFRIIWFPVYGRWLISDEERQCKCLVHREEVFSAQSERLVRRFGLLLSTLEPSNKYEFWV